MHSQIGSACRNGVKLGLSLLVAGDWSSAAIMPRKGHGGIPPEIRETLCGPAPSERQADSV